eukprot:364314-Chlamydomonas_euryale.AAC.1
MRCLCKTGRMDGCVAGARSSTQFGRRCATAYPSLLALMEATLQRRPGHDSLLNPRPRRPRHGSLLKPSQPEAS